MTRLISTFLAVVTPLVLVGCLSMDSHQNFMNTLQLSVGRSLSNPYLYTNRNRNLYVATKPLPNGNVEEEFKGGRGPTCRVFFEIDNKAEKVVSWRYEGSDEDCAITP